MPIIIKGDVQGSVEAITTALEKLGNEEVAARVIHGGVGGVTESDVTLAVASKAVIIGFNVRAHKEARDLAEQQGVEIRYYNIIYNLVDDVKAAMSGMLAPTMRETMLGNAQILEVFTISKVGNVAGCRVTDGVVQRGAHVRLIRDNVVVHEGKLSTLKRFKDEVPIVQAGQECGMAFENYQDMRKGDVIDARCGRVRRRLRHDRYARRGQRALQLAVCHLCRRHGVRRRLGCRRVLVLRELFRLRFCARIHSRGSLERKRTQRRIGVVGLGRQV